MAANKPQTNLTEMVQGLGPAHDGYEPFFNQILVGIYMGPEKTAGGIIRPDSNRDEDKWQGKVGVVIKKGVMAFQSNERDGTEFYGQDVQIGDWVVYRISDGFPIDINGVHCRLIEDVHVKGRVSDPTMIY